MRRLIAAAVAIAGMSGPAVAAERGYTLTSFDRVRIAGPIDVTVSVGGGTAVRAVGDARLIDRLVVRVENSSLVVRPDAAAAGGWPGGRLKVIISTPVLRAAELDGSGAVAIDRVRGDRFDAIVAGSGSMAVARVDVTRLGAELAGSGGLTIAGQAAAGRVAVRGSGTLAGEEMRVTDLDAATAGSGDIRIAAGRTARVSATGSGDVTILGTPACTVRQTGSGTVSCGK